MSPAYQLNLVYLIPSELSAFDDVKPRWTRVLKYVQDFYKKEMARNGFGEKTFGLPFDSDGHVQFLMYKTTKPSSAYTVETIANAKEEVEQQYSNHPNEKHSDHYLVVIPTNSSNPRNPDDGGNTPLVGLIGGHICFALDYDGFDIQYEHGSSGQIKNDKWLGGLAHELGHGFNLPHNAQLKGDTEYALMGDGNTRFQQGTVQLTRASCAILNNCQVFSDVEKQFYTPDGTFELQNLTIVFDDSSIGISCTFESDKDVNAVNVYVDDFDDHERVPHVPNTAYDAESWCVTDVSQKRFALTIDRNKIDTTSRDTFFIKMRYLFVDGTFHEDTYSFKRSNTQSYHYEK